MSVRCLTPVLLPTWGKNKQTINYFDLFNSYRFKFSLGNNRLGTTCHWHLIYGLTNCWIFGLFTGFVHKMKNLQYCPCLKNMLLLNISVQTTKTRL